MQISFQQVSSAAWEGVKERGPNHEDQSRLWAKYFRGSTPSCHVGFVLHQLGVRWLFGFRNNMCIEVFSKWSRFEFSPEALYFLTELQERNDTKTPWGRGYAAALQMTYLRFPHLRESSRPVPQPAVRSLVAV